MKKGAGRGKEGRERKEIRGKKRAKKGAKEREEKQGEGGGAKGVKQREWTGRGS